MAFTAKRVLKTTIFIIVNPHLIPCIILGLTMAALRKSLRFISDKIDDAERKIEKLDKYLGSKNIPTWLDKLVIKDK